MMKMENLNPNSNSNIEIPVMFYDGEREIDLGKVEITPTITTFKLLQSTLSNKIGISPNHITIYLDRNDVETHRFNHHRRRHPVTSKFDFTALEVGNCFFWVVLKRGRRNRRRRNKNDAVVGGGSPPLVLLRRGFDYNYHINNHWDYLNQLKIIDQIEREKEMRYIMSLNLNSNVYNELSGYGFNQPNNYNTYNKNNNYDYNYGNYSDEFETGSSSTGGASSSERVFCDVCYNHSTSAADTVPFHWCKNDVVVTTGFRSSVGPIAPPSKKSPLY